MVPHSPITLSANTHSILIPYCLISSKGVPELLGTTNLGGHKCKQVDDQLCTISITFVSKQLHMYIVQWPTMLSLSFLNDKITFERTITFSTVCHSENQKKLQDFALMKAVYSNTCCQGICHMIVCNSFACQEKWHAQVRLQYICLSQRNQGKRWVTMPTISWKRLLPQFTTYRFLRQGGIS